MKRASRRPKYIPPEHLLEIARTCLFCIRSNVDIIKVLFHALELEEAKWLFDRMLSSKHSDLVTLLTREESTYAYFYSGLLLVFNGRREEGWARVKKARNNGFIPALGYYTKYCEKAALLGDANGMYNFANRPKVPPFHSI